jgi:hypothetical protein
MTNNFSAGQESNKILDYFSRNGAPCPPDANPAEHIIDVIQGSANSGVDWVDVWKNSEERKTALKELDALNAAGMADPDYVEDTADFATSRWFQFKMVSKRLTIQIWRSPVRNLDHTTRLKPPAANPLTIKKDYMWNKMILHIFAALFSGFTFWKIGDGTFSLQLRLFAIFNFIFVAPGCINQMQPFFLHNRDIFETREKKVTHISDFPVTETLLT